MYFPDKEKFIELAKKGNVIPVYREMLTDFDTPLSAFQKIDEGNFSYLLESVEGGERLGRYSFLGGNPSLIFESKGKTISIKRGDKVETYQTKEDPVSEIKSIMSRLKFVAIDGLPRFCGGLVGYMGYDVVRFFENIPDKNPDDLDIPDTQFALTDTIIIFDHVDHKVKVVSNSLIEKDDPGEAYDKACKKIDRLVEKLKGPTIEPEDKEANHVSSEIESNFTKEAFHQIVEEAKEHIRAGDIIQVVLSQRLKSRISSDAFTVYRALR
ncbi:MAG: anthranilate synthase component I, partial [Candidatus Omnitrophota bacterium]